MPKSNLPDKGSPQRKDDKVYPHLLTKSERLRRQALEAAPHLEGTLHGLDDPSLERFLRRIK